MDREPVIRKELAGDARVAALRDRVHRPDAGVPVLAELSQRWALPIHRLGIDQVIDMHTSQRKTRPGPILGTFYLDGGPFLTHLPKRLHNRPPSRSA